VTWNTAPTAGTTISSLGAVAAGNTYQLDVSSAIHGDGTYTFRVSTPNADGADYTSRDGVIGSRPQLVVNVAP
jgi:hypothetical protein